MKLLKSILAAICWMLFVYGCISFFYMDINPKTWPLRGRFFMVCFGFLISLIIFGAMQENQQDNEK